MTLQNNSNKKNSILGKLIYLLKANKLEKTQMKPQLYAWLVHMEEIAVRIHHSHQDGRVEFVLRESGEGHTLYIREDLWIEYLACKPKKLNEGLKQ
jgi:hypothetical protein